MKQKTRLTEGLSSLGDSLSDKFSSLKEGVGGFFSKMFGGDDENAKHQLNRNRKT